MSKWVSAAAWAYRRAQRVFELMVGVVFMFLAGVGAAVSLSEWNNYLEHRSAGLFRFYLYSGFTIVLIFFCLYSFLKARSIR